jgi:DNA-binding LacI/PurR family transcriptional regulator
LRKKWIIEGGFELTDGKESFRKLLSTGDLPEIVFAVNDRVALGVYIAAREAGLDIPADIGVMGYGFSDTTDIFNPSLSVINQDSRKMGRASAQRLIEEIEAEKKVKRVKIRLEESFLWKGSLRKTK